jgi:hypothetical protein
MSHRRIGKEGFDVRKEQEELTAPVKKEKYFLF